MNNTLHNNDFFNLIASDYDEMVSFAQSVEKKKEAFKSMNKPWMKTAADLGCGTGADSIALASLGLEVTAFDPSFEMLEVAKGNVEKAKVKVTLHNKSVDSIAEDFNEQFDLVVSLGNTFANIEREQLLKSLQRTKEILKPQGIILIQILNYEKILSKKQRIVNITKGADKFFIRFYDFVDDEITFNILIFNKEKPFERKLISTKLFPHTQEDFDAVLKSIEFSKVEYCSDFNRTIFNNEESKDLIVIATKE